MRATLRFPPLACCLILLAIGAIPIDASIRPSFSLDQSTWNATHIVLVQTTALIVEVDLGAGAFSICRHYRKVVGPQRLAWTKNNYGRKLHS